MDAMTKMRRSISAIRKIWTPAHGRSYRVNDLAELRREMIARYSTNTRTDYFDGASTNRLRDDWVYTSDIPYEEIKGALSKLIARSRREVNNSGIARSIVSSILENVIGSGIWPKPMVKDNSGNLVVTVNKKLEAGWERYVEQWDRAGQSNFYDVQHLALETIIVSGTVIVNKVNAEKGAYLRTSYQMIEPDRLDESYDVSKITLEENDPQKQILHGIGIDEYFRPVRYYIKGVEKPISASNMFHVFRRRRCEQTIGYPWLSPVLSDLWDFRQLKEDTLVKSRILADIALWARDSEAWAGAKNDSDEVVWEPGQIIRTKEKPEVVQGDDKIGESFKPLVDIVLLNACAGMGQSLMTVSRDMAGVNYAASRTNLMADRRGYRVIQEWFVNSFCQRIWTDFVTQMVLEGRSGGLTVDAFSKDPFKYTRALWRADGWDWVDPSNDADASTKMYSYGLTSLGAECAKRSVDWRDHMNQLKEEQDYAGEIGLKLPTPQKPEPKSTEKQKTPEEKNGENKSEE